MLAPKKLLSPTMYRVVQVETFFMFLSAACACLVVSSGLTAVRTGSTLAGGTADERAETTASTASAVLAGSNVRPSWDLTTLNFWVFLL